MIDSRKNSESNAENVAAMIKTPVNGDNAEQEMAKLNGDSTHENVNIKTKTDGKKKKKKKTSKETKQKRKERKKFDLEGQYKDMELPSFKSAMEDPLAHLEEPPKKKSKKTK